VEAGALVLDGHLHGLGVNAVADRDGGLGGEAGVAVAEGVADGLLVGDAEGELRGLRVVAVVDGGLEALPKRADKGPVVLDPDVRLTDARVTIGHGSRTQSGPIGGRKAGGRRLPQGSAGSPAGRSRDSGEALHRLVGGLVD